MTFRRTRVLISVAMLTALGTVIGGFWHARRTSRDFLWFFPPSDISLPLACTDFQVGAPGKTMSLTFTPKYIGPHSFEVFFQHPPHVSAASPLVPSGAFALELRIYRRDSLLVTRRQVGPLNWSQLGIDTAAGYRGYLTNFRLFYFEIPEELPARTGLRAELIVSEPDPEFAAQYGRKEVCVLNQLTPIKWSPPWQVLNRAAR